MKAEHKNRHNHADKNGKLSRQERNGNSNRKIASSSAKPSSVKHQAKASKPNRSRSDNRNSKASRSSKHHNKTFAANNRRSERNR